MELDGRVALVTGGAIRVGRAIVEALAAGGATVAVHHHRAGPAAAQLVAELQAQGRGAQAFVADLTDDAQLERLVQEVQARARAGVGAGQQRGQLHPGRF